MVTNLTLASIIFQGLIAVLFVVGLYVFLRKRERFSFRPVWVGMLVFFVFTQVFEKIWHLVFLQGGAEPSGLLSNPILFGLYGALSAGLFEEVGRYVGFRLLLKQNRERKDGIAYGLGHGGFEAIFIGVIASVQTFLFAILIQSGKFEQTLGAQLSPDMVATLKEQIVSAPAFLFLLGGIERIPVLFIQIALSLLVLYGIRMQKHVFLLYAILLHALIDFVPGLYQGYKGALNIWLVEGIVLLFGVAAVWFILSSKNWRGWENTPK